MMPYDEMLFNMAYFAIEGTAANAENENALKEKQAVLAYLATLVVYDKKNAEGKQIEVLKYSSVNDMHIITSTDAEDPDAGVTNETIDFTAGCESGSGEPGTPPLDQRNDHVVISKTSPPLGGEGVGPRQSTSSARESMEDISACPVCAESLIPPDRRRRRGRRHRARRTSRCAVGNASTVPDGNFRSSESTGRGSFVASSTEDAYGECNSSDTWATRSFDAEVAALQQQEQERKKWPGVLTLPSCKHTFHGARMFYLELL